MYPDAHGLVIKLKATVQPIPTRLGPPSQWCTLAHCPGGFPQPPAMGLLIPVSHLLERTGLVWNGCLQSSSPTKYWQQIGLSRACERSRSFSPSVKLSSNPIFFSPPRVFPIGTLDPALVSILFPLSNPNFRSQRRLYHTPSAAVPKRQDHPSPASSSCAHGTSYTLRTGPLEPRPSSPPSLQTQMYVYTHYSHALQTTLRIYTFLHLLRWDT